MVTKVCKATRNPTTNFVKSKVLYIWDRPIVWNWIANANNKARICVIFGSVVKNQVSLRYDTIIRCYFNMQSKADMSRLNLPHGTDN